MFYLSIFSDVNVRLCIEAIQLKIYLFHILQENEMISSSIKLIVRHEIEKLIYTLQ
jgi:hypothetical protein